jgi:hypothetical protein
VPPPTSAEPSLRPALLAAAGVAGAALVLYASTACRDLALVDSAELALACATGGVPHPPGVPLYRLLGGIFAKLPLGSPAAALNLMSAFFAALAVGATFLAADRLLAFRDASEPAPRAPVAPRRRLLAALAAALAFATSWNPWTWSAMAEVYSLNVFLVAAAWAAGWAAILPGAGAGPAIAAVLLASFGLANHHATSALMFPILLVMAAAARPALLRTPRFLAVSLGAAALSLSLYLTLIPAARHDPGLGWGGTTTLATLARHVTGAQYSLQVETPWEESRRVIGEFASTLVSGCGVPAAFLAAAGLLAGFARRRPRAALLAGGAPLLMIALNLILSARYVAGPEDRMAYDLPATVAWCLLAGAGAATLLERSRLPRGVAAAIVLALPAAWNVVRNFPLCDLRRERCARILAEDVLGDLPPRSLVFTAEWNVVAPYLYMRHVEGWRADLRVIDVLMMRRFWYLDYVERTMPELAAASRPEFDRFREQIRLFDLGRPYDRANMQSLYDALMTRWVEIGRSEGGAFADWVTPTLPQEVSWVRWLPAVPDGMRLRFPAPGDQLLSRPPSPRDVANLRYLRSKLTDASLDGDRSALIPRHDPYWKVWSQYQAAVTASLLAALRQGEDEFAARKAELATWFPEVERAAARARSIR